MLFPQRPAPEQWFLKLNYGLQQWDGQRLENNNGTDGTLHQTAGKDFRTSGFCVQKIDGVAKEIGEIKIQTTITSGCVSAQEKRINDLESEKHVPATCTLLPELEGLKRETQGLI